MERIGTMEPRSVTAGKVNRNFDALVKLVGELQKEIEALKGAAKAASKPAKAPAKAEQADAE